MANLQLLRLSKHFNNLNAGEVAGFSPATAAHILKNGGAELIGPIDTSKQLFVVDADGKDAIVDAVRDPSGNLIPKEPEAKKEPPPKDPPKK